MPYTVRFYSGDYPERQAAANRDKADCYVEQHFNSSTDRKANYAMTVVATNASSLSKEWARWYTHEISALLKIPDKGANVGGYQGRGNANLKYTAMPAILLEPCFISCQEGAQAAAQRVGDLAEILARSIARFFPLSKDADRLIAFSIGHMGKSSNPGDMGAKAISGQMEATLAKAVLERAKQMLESQGDALDPSTDTDEPIPAQEASDWAQEAQRWVIAGNISDGTRPHDPVTREEVWTMLARLRRP